MEDRGYSTSPDPISIMTGSSPARSAKKGSALRSIQHNARSPRKSVLLQPHPNDDGTSPWRIKLTIEAETEPAPPKINRRSTLQTKNDLSRSTRQKVPVRDHITQRNNRISIATPSAMQPTTQYVGADTPDWARGHAVSPQPDTSGCNSPHFTQASMVARSGLQSQVPGDATTIENEEFSMVSVESLNSRNGNAAQDTTGNNIEVSALSTHGFAKSTTNWSYMPSSPPVVEAKTSTPQIAQTPLQAPGPVQSLLRNQKVSTPLRQSVLRSGKVLQDIVRTPEQAKPLSHSLFDGFSSNARRDLRESLQIGMNMATMTAPQPSVPTSDLKMQTTDRGLTYPDVSKAEVDHRLPTPEELEAQNPSRKSDCALAGYPDLSAALVAPPSRIPKASNDLMSWAPTGSEQRIKPVRHDSAAPSQPEKTVDEVIEVSSELSDELEDESELEEEIGDEQKVHQDVDMDMWQEEANRPSTSGSNETAPIEEVNDDEMESDAEAEISDLSDDEEMNVGTPFEKAQPSYVSSAPRSLLLSVADVGAAPISPALSAHSDLPSTSTDGDDSGLFWQTNMPNVYQRRRRQEESSTISELKPISSDSPMVGSSQISSRNSARQSAKSKRPDLARKGVAMNSPLRRSLLRSSKIGQSAPDVEPSAVSVVKNSNEQQSLGDINSSMNGAEYTDLMDDEAGGGSWIESTDLQASKSDSRSYVEHLNLDSPARIAVKFNDSSEEAPLVADPGESPLGATPRLAINVTNISPSKKKYGALFQNDAPLGAQDASESTVVEEHKVGLNRLRQVTAAKPSAAPAPSSTSRSFMSQMTSSLWSAVTPKTAPTKPMVVMEPVKVKTGDALPDLTLRLRRKYGILGTTHPFTIYHAHTLQRLWQSTVQRPDKTTIPLYAPLTPDVAELVQLPSHPSEAQIHIASCFMTLLVPDAEQHQDRWGDATAAQLRGWDSKGRHGSWCAFDGDTREDKAARAKRGEIEIEWVLDLLVDIVQKHG